MARTLPGFFIQWHVTALCDQHCRHCYLKNDPVRYQTELRDELSLGDCKKVMDSLVDCCRQAEARPVIAFTGGDPLMRRDFFDILLYAYNLGIKVFVMGNPYYLTGEAIVRMKELGVKSYQVSIDGLENAHDGMRQPGSFQATVDGITQLKSCGMKSVVMFTISKQNANELSGVMRLVSEIGVDVFAFARYSRGTDEVGPCTFGEDFSPAEYRQVLLGYQRLAGELNQAGSQTRFNFKDHLWKLLWYEQGSLHLPDNPRQQIISGCHIGRCNLTILSDGQVYACRRFHSPIGRVPERSILEIFTSKELDWYRQVRKFEKCSGCELLNFCRGCPAVAYGVSGGNYFAPDPQCWK